jgi:hypothetical protein
VRVPMESKDGRFWDEWWRDRLAEVPPDADMLPRFHQVPLGKPGNLSYETCWRSEFWQVYICRSVMRWKIAIPALIIVSLALAIALNQVRSRQRSRSFDHPSFMTGTATQGRRNLK